MKIHIKAKPGAKTAYVKKIGDSELFKESAGDRFVVAVQEKAIAGQANWAIEKAIAAYFKVSVLRVRIVSGQTAREKVVEIL